MSDKPRGPHWAAGTDTKAVLADRENGERFAHIAYGELVKHFGLGTTHTFASWNQLPEDERAKWIAALSEARGDEKEAEQNAAQSPAH